MARTDPKLFWPASVLLLGVIMGILSWWPSSDNRKAHQLAAEGVATEGRILAIRYYTDGSSSVSDFKYRYAVGRMEYFGTDTLRTPRSDQIRRAEVGDPITVYYIPREPKFSCTGSPKSKLEWYRGFQILGMVMAVFGAVLLIFCAWKARKT